VLYPDGTKDANDYFKIYSPDEYKTLIRNALPFYKHKFKDLSSVIQEMKIKGENRLTLDTVPFIKFKADWMVMVSGDSNVGKSTYVMNIANELANKGIPTLILPFERGIKDVGGRFIQVRCDRTEDELIAFDDDDWEKIIPDLINLPLYFSMPSKESIKEFVLKAKRFFGIRVVIIDHLDYNLASGTNNEVAEMKKLLTEWKNELCIDNELIFIVVHHIKKPEGVGLAKRKPKKEDLKGGSTVYQVPEGVIMLSEPEKGKLEVEVVKNKGEEGSKIYDFKKNTGRMGTEVKLEDKRSATQKAFDEF
jgi:hypothetical protein